MEADTTNSQEQTTSEVSKETETVVEKNIPNASETVKQKTMELMDVIKKRLQSQFKCSNLQSNSNLWITLFYQEEKIFIAKGFDCKRDKLLTLNNFLRIKFLNY